MSWRFSSCNRDILYLGHLVGCEINDITFHSKGEAVSLDVSVDDFILFDYFSAVLEYLFENMLIHHEI